MTKHKQQHEEYLILVIGIWQRPSIWYQ